MSYQLYQAEVRIMYNGNCTTRVSLSVTRDDYSKFFAAQSRSNPNKRFGTVSQKIITHVPGHLYEFIKQQKSNGIHGVWEDEIKVSTI